MTDEQRDERAAHEQAYRLARQAVIDAAMDLNASNWEEYQYIAAIPLGRMQDLTNAIDVYRSLGGFHSDEAADLMAVTT